MKALRLLPGSAVALRAPVVYLDAYCQRRRGPRQFRADRIRELTDLRTGEVAASQGAVLRWIADLLVEADPEHYAIPAQCPGCQHALGVTLAQAKAHEAVRCGGCGAEIHLEVDSSFDVTGARPAVEELAASLRELGDVAPHRQATLKNS